MAVLASIALAALSFHFYESRFLRLKRNFRYKFSDASGAIGMATAESQLPAMTGPEISIAKLP
jgi:peptidoglycan/LPS O-acetylase OafA/YrhL